MDSVREAEIDLLMGRLARGDRTAFAPLYTVLRPRAVHLARLRLGDTDAPDVAQAALLKVFARASDFVPGRPCLPWFYAVVANEIRACRRKGNRFCTDDGSGERLLLDLDDPETQLLGRELERSLELALDALDDEAALAIRAMLGRTALPDVHPPTFRKRVSRAYAKLRLLLGGRDVG